MWLNNSVYKVRVFVVILYSFHWFPDYQKNDFGGLLASTCFSPDSLK